LRGEALALRVEVLALALRVEALPYLKTLASTTSLYPAILHNWQSVKGPEFMAFCSFMQLFMLYVTEAALDLRTATSFSK